MTIDIKKTRIARYAANLKRALHTAFNIEFQGRSYYENKKSYSNEQSRYHHQMEQNYRNENDRNNHHVQHDGNFLTPWINSDHSFYPRQAQNFHNVHSRPPVSNPDSQFEMFKNDLKNKLISKFD